MFHLQVEVVAFPGALTHAGEHRDAAVVHGDVVDHFHHDDGLAHAGAAEHPHLAAPGEGHQQVDDLDAGFQHFNGGVLVHEGGRRAVNGVIGLGIHRTQAVHRAAHHVEHPAEGLMAHRHHDGIAGVFHGHAPDQAVGGVHGDGAHHVVPQVLGHFHHQIVFDVVDGRVADEQTVFDGRQFTFLKFHVHYRTDNAGDSANVHCLKILLIRAA